MNITEEVRKLDLPMGEYIVLGSGILGALGIREIGDIDLLVNPSVFDRLRADGWDYDEIEIEGQIREHLSRGDVEVYRDFWYGGHHPDPATLIADSYMIDGIPFLSLQKLSEIKRILARPKDLRDIELIDTYLSKKTVTSMTRNIFLLSMMSPLDERLQQTLAQEILRRGTKVAYISSSPQSGDQPYYQSTIADYAAISPDIHVDYFDLSDAFTDQMLAELSSYAAIYLSGGNTFTFMDSARKRGLQTILEQYLANGGVLIGASAGSIMCTPSIELAKFGDENEVGMTDFSGFGFVDFEFHPHFTGEQVEREQLSEYQLVYGRDIYTCKNDAGLHVSDSGVEAFGDASKLMKK